MDPHVSSFIPKKALDTANARGGGVRSTGLLLLLAILIFIASLVAAGAVFAYQGLLNQSIASKSNSLALNQKAYDPGVIQELLRMDSRIKEAKGLLERHVAPSAIFVFLSQQTLERVQFTSFDYGIGQDGDIQINLKGVTDTFSSVALQSDQFGASKVLKDIIFSGVNSDTLGKINFSVSATVVPSLISYSNALAATPFTPLEAPPAQTSSTTPPTP